MLELKIQTNFAYQILPKQSYLPLLQEIYDRWPILQKNNTLSINLETIVEVSHFKQTKKQMLVIKMGIFVKTFSCEERPTS